jgi:UDPglucose--hexose-1-phosphate uridylyltransferase
MTRYLFDPIRGYGVLYAPERNLRPIALAPPELAAPESGSLDATGLGSADPFAPGAERETPSEVWAVRPHESARDSADWRLRVVPNRYPIVTAGECVEAAGAGCETESMPSNTVWGRHEVVIECRNGTGDLADFSDDELELVVEAWRGRLAAFAEDPSLRWASLFRNTGLLAGASLPHPHSQLIGLSFVPPAVQATRQTAEEYRAEYGRCHLCDEVEAAGERLVDTNGLWTAWCPGVSRVAGEVRIAPNRHEAYFHLLAAGDVAEFAAFLGRLLRRVRRLFAHDGVSSEGAGHRADLAYNITLNEAPFPRVGDVVERGAIDHWSLEILPRTGGIAGFELGSQLWVNPLLPEVAAQRLRAPW